MAPSSSRGAFVLARWLAVLAFVLTFLSPLGASVNAQPEPLAAETLELHVMVGEVFTGDLNQAVSGGVGPYTFAITQLPTVGTMDLHLDGSFTYTAPEDVGTTSITYTVTDSTFATANGLMPVFIHGPLGTIPLSVNAVAGEPLYRDVSGQVIGGTPPYSFTIATNPSQGSLTFNSNGTFTYTADEGATGTDQFTYSVSDSEAQGASVGAAATVTGVVNVNIAAPSPTPTTAPTETTVPTATIAPTETIVPSATTIPTETAAPTATIVPTEATAPTLEPIVPTPTRDPGDPTATATGTPGTTPISTVVPNDPTRTPGAGGSSVTKLPNTGQGDVAGSGVSSAALLAAMLTIGLVLLAVAASRLHRR